MAFGLDPREAFNLCRLAAAATTQK